MKHSIFIISITSLILTSCAQDTRTEDLPTTRPDFFIQTQELSRFTSTLTRETTTTIDAGSTLSLDAESSGKVKKIHFNE